MEGETEREKTSPWFALIHFVPPTSSSSLSPSFHCSIPRLSLSSFVITRERESFLFWFVYRSFLYDCHVALFFLFLLASSCSFLCLSRTRMNLFLFNAHAFILLIEFYSLFFSVRYSSLFTVHCSSSHASTLFLRFYSVSVVR